MKAPSPAFSLYPKDILSDEACTAMTDEELGVHVRLICHAWLEGSIPADPDRLARMTRRRRQQFDRIWKAVGPCWSQSSEEPERLIQKRLECERMKQIAFSAKQSERGKQGGRPRVSSTRSAKEKSHGLAAGKPDESRMKAEKSLPSPSPSPSPTPITDNGNGFSRADARVTWLTPYVNTWKSVYPDGEAPIGPMAKALRSLDKQHGSAKVCPELDAYLRVTPIEYLNLGKFAAAFGTWCGGGQVAVRSKPSVAERNRNAADQWEQEVLEGKR